MQDRISRIDENLLHRTAGPYIRVNRDKTQSEQKESAFPPESDCCADISKSTLRTTRRHCPSGERRSEVAGGNADAITKCRRHVRVGRKARRMRDCAQVKGSIP